MATPCTSPCIPAPSHQQQNIHHEVGLPPLPLRRAVLRLHLHPQPSRHHLRRRILGHDYNNHHHYNYNYNNNNYYYYNYNNYYYYINNSYD